MGATARLGHIIYGVKIPIWSPSAILSFTGSGFNHFAPSVDPKSIHDKISAKSDDARMSYYIVTRKCGFAITMQCNLKPLDPYVGFMRICHCGLIPHIFAAHFVLSRSAEHGEQMDDQGPFPANRSRSPVLAGYVPGLCAHGAYIDLINCGKMTDTDDHHVLFALMFAASATTLITSR